MRTEKTTTLDFETFCELDVRQVGAHRYSEHPSCEVLIMVYRLPGKRNRVWLPHRDGRELPRDLQQYIEDDDGTLTAHNAQFEACIWQNVLVARHGAPPVAARRWRCTAAKAAAAGMPRALANLGPALRLRVTKDREGTRLINIFCKPRKPTKNIPATRIYPDDKPEEFAKFVNYCGTDVDTEAEADAVLPDLSAYEWRAYRHTEKMNARGLPIDMEAVRAGYKVLQVLEKRVVARVEQLTGGIRPTQRDKMLEFFNSLGLEMENTQAKTIKDLVLLKGDELEPKTKELLLLRIEGGKASTKKLKKILQVVCTDGRVRGAFLYWGASTGRLAGRLIQPQNFTRGEYTPAQLHALFKLLLQEDPDAIEIIHEWPIDALAQGMRGYIKAPPGMKFVVVDFAAIEARVVVWLARQMDVIQAYHANADLYKRLAVKLYHLKSEDEVTTMQRKFAKDIWLGCLGEGTLVLTRRGWVPIIQVSSGDKVWDGVEWVSTSGCTYSGNKEVIDLCGIVVTPEHKVLCGQRWVDAASVTKSWSALRSALDTAGLPFSRFGSGVGAQLGGTSVSASAARSYSQGRVASSLGLRGLATTAQNLLRQRRLSKGVRPENTPSQKLDYDTVRTALFGVLAKLVEQLGSTLENALRAARTTLTRAGFSIAPRLPNVLNAGVSGGAYLQGTQSTRTCTLDSQICTSAAGPDTTLETRGCASATGGSTLGYSLKTARNYPGMPRARTTLNSTGGTTAVTTPQKTAASLPSKKTSKTAEVYDLVECGPRSRFTVMSDAGPIIVHNSGFQLGWAGFISNCLKRGIVVTEAEAKKGINTYRDENPMVVKLWADVEECAIRAAQTSASSTKPVVLRNLSFFVDGIWLCIKLPSGRLLRYPYPEVQNVLRYRKMVKKLTFRSEIKGKWVREGTYGGKLVENIVQATARDLMVNACFNAEAEGYEIVGTVHDELIALVPQDFGSAHELEEILRKKPSWATDCPVNAEGWQDTRYRK